MTADLCNGVSPVSDGMLNGWGEYRKIQLSIKLARNLQDNWQIPDRSGY